MVGLSRAIRSDPGLAGLTDQAIEAGYASDSGDPRGSNFRCRRSASVKVSTTALTSETMVATTLFGLVLRVGFFLAAVFRLFFATVLRFFLATAVDFFFAFFFVFAADFLRAFLAIGSPPVYASLRGISLSSIPILRQGLQQP
jgi:hypothetical protein